MCEACIHVFQHTPCLMMILCLSRRRWNHPVVHWYVYLDDHVAYLYNIIYVVHIYIYTYITYNIYIHIYYIYIYIKFIQILVGNPSVC
jgi:cellulose synthase/poly-beta-1,6-N-acetylglucosamine synthase-like glycosyltransferase